MRPLCGILCWILFTGLSWAGDWPEFNGPDRDGISKEKALASSWSKEGPKVLWQLNVGPGFGGAVIQNGKVYFTDREDDEKDLVRCLDFKTGKELWRMSKDRPGRLPYNGSRCTPTADGDRVFAISPFGHLYAVSTKDGSLLWEHDFLKEFGGETPYFGFSHSPLVLGDLVIVAPMSAKANVVAYNKVDGTLVWQSEGSEGECYVSPLAVDLFGKQQVLMLDKGGLKSLNPADGKELWRYEGYKNRVPIPYPTVVPGNRLLLSGGYNGGSVLIQLKQKDGKVEAEELFRLDKRGSQIHQVIYYQDHFYANFNNNENLKSKKPEGLVCIDMNGNNVWETQNKPEVNRGNIMIADGKLFTMGGENGVLRMLTASPKGFKELASATIFETKARDNMIWAPMALSDGKMIVRDQKIMKCLALR